MQRSKAAGTDFDLYRFTVTHQRLLVDIGKELGLGMSIGMTDVVARHSVL